MVFCNRLFAPADFACESVEENCLRFTSLLCGLPFLRISLHAGVVYRRRTFATSDDRLTPCWRRARSWFSTADIARLTSRLGFSMVYGYGQQTLASSDDRLILQIVWIFFCRVIGCAPDAQHGVVDETSNSALFCI